MMKTRRLKSTETNTKYSFKKDINDFIEFIKSNLNLALANIFFILLTYGIKLFQYSISIDTECIIDDQNRLLQSWLTIDRYGLVLLKNIFGTVNFTPYVATFLMLNTLFVLNMFLCFCFKYFYLGDIQDNVKCKIGLFVFSAVFITFPSLAEQFNFLLQGFEVAVAMLLSVISAFLILKWSMSQYTKENILYLLIGLIVLTISFASYQSIIFFFISVISSFLILFCLGNREHDKDINLFKVSVKCLSMFLLACILYLSSNAVVNIFYPKSKYLDGKVLWKVYSFEQCCNIIFRYIKQVFLGDNIFFSKWFALFTLIFVFIVITTKFYKKTILLISSFVLILSPFMLSFVLANIVDIRAQIMLPFVLAVECMVVLFSANRAILKNSLMVLCIYISLNQSYTVNRLLYTEQMKYEEDVAIANDIAVRIGKLGLGEIPSNKPVVFLGVHYPKDNSNSLRGEVLGHSFWEWDGYDNYRKHGLMKVLGYSYMYPSDEQIAYAQELSTKMPEYPSEECVAEFKNMIIVKLSN